MKFAIASGAALALALAAAPASAASVLVDFADAGLTPANADVFQNFDSLAVGSSLGTLASVYNGTASGTAAQPAYGSAPTNYGAVLGGGSAQFDFGKASKSFGFTLGSLDGYNTLELLFDNATSIVLSSGQIINGMSFDPGSQSAPNANGFVRIFSTGAEKITGVKFSSSQNSFEFDNLATGVPEPTTWAMMILGIGFAGAAMRRRQTVSVKYA